MKKGTAKGMHNGHRERLRNKIDKFGFGALTDHELLEFYLFGVYNRINTNDIAHSLIKRFGSLKGVIDASPEELRSVEKIGKSGSLFINGFSEMMRRYFLTNATNEKFDSVSKVGTYFVRRFIGEGNEKVYLMLLDNSMGFIDCALINDGSVNSAAFDLTKAYRYAFERKAAIVILAHNHPHGIAVPSEDDRRTTAALANGFASLGINLVEHFIVVEDRYTPIFRNSQNPAERRNAEEMLTMDDAEYISGRAEK